MFQSIANSFDCSEPRLEAEDAAGFLDAGEWRMQNVVKCDRRVALGYGGLPFIPRKKLEIGGSVIPRRDGSCIGSHRDWLPRCDVKRLSDRVVRLLDYELERSSDIVSVDMLKSCEPFVRQCNYIAASEAFEHTHIEIAGGIDRAPAGSRYVSGVQNRRWKSALRFT